MRSLSDWVASASPAALAAGLAAIVIGAGLCGFAIAELTSDDGRNGARTARRAPTVVYAIRLVGQVGTPRNGDWFVFTGHFAGRAAALDYAKRLAVKYRGATVELVQSSQ
jgi:hypothetical protein